MLRNAELERGDRPSGFDDPRELGERRGGIVDVAQQVGEGQVVELGVGERELLGLAGDVAFAAPGCRRARAVASISGL